MQAEAQTISVDYKGNNSVYMSLGGVANHDGMYTAQPFMAGIVPSSPSYLQNVGFSHLTNQVREAYHSSKPSSTDNIIASGSNQA